MVCSIRETRWLSNIKISFSTNDSEIINDVLFLSGKLFNPEIHYGRPLINDDTISFHFQTQGWKHPQIKNINDIERKLVNKIFWITEVRFIQNLICFLLILPIRLFFRIFKRLLKLTIS